ncbi:MAG: alpha/beta fold hydrolase [Bacteroidota bacterium]
MKPSTRYAKSGRINIAYQVFGSGPVDLVYIPGWVSNIDLMWACPELVRFLEELAKIARVILFDKRGTGLSDRIVELSTLEERMDDIRAVMDAVSSEKAILFGHSEGGSASALFAATYPNRTISLITFGIFAKRIFAPHYPWAPTSEERQVVYEMIEYNWGSGEMNLESLAPSKADDKAFMDWLANYLRSGASPSAALVLTKMNTEVDIIDILGSIKVPTLIMQRTHDIDVKIEEGRFIAERISDAKFVELDGADHLFWVGNTDEVLDEMKQFIRKDQPASHYDRQLFTIVHGRGVAVPTLSMEHHSLIDQYVRQYRGKIVQYDQHTFTAVFEGPSKAVHCSMDLVEAIQEWAAQLAIGIHIMEVPVTHFIGPATDRWATALLTPPVPGQIVLTQTVKNLLVGAGLHFKTYKSIYDFESGNSLLLYWVGDTLRGKSTSDRGVRKKVPQNDSLLENVLQTIDQNLGNEFFSVEMLSREVGVSERQLQRKLKAITNKSPNQLISSVRLHRAKELILSQRYNVAEIAFQTGFSNPSYFSKTFKKEFGVSPSALTNRRG